MRSCIPPTMVFASMRLPWYFTAFHPDWKMLDRPPTPPATLHQARRIALKNGVRYAYTGNVHDQEGGSTCCHACGQILIGRDWFTLSEWRLTPDGRWGARRLPIRLSGRAT